MPFPTITELPPAPSRQNPANFSQDADALLGALPTLVEEVNTAGDYVETRAVDAKESEDAAAQSAEDAAASAAAAAAIVDAEPHVPNAAYVVNNAVISNTNHQTYRCIVAHSGVATDPSADATNWVLITFDGAYDSLTGKPTLGTVADKNTGTTSGSIPILGAGGELPAVGGANLVGVVGSGLTRAVKTTITNGATAVDIALPVGDGVIMIEGRAIGITGSGIISLTTSTDGVSFDSASGDYRRGGAGTPSSIQVTYDDGSWVSFWGFLRSANDPNDYFSVEFYSTVDGINTSAPNVGTRFAKEAVTHIKLSLNSGSFSGGEILVSRVLEAS